MRCGSGNGLDLIAPPAREPPNVLVCGAVMGGSGRTAALAARAQGLASQVLAEGLTDDGAGGGAFLGGAPGEGVGEVWGEADLGDLGGGGAERWAAAAAEAGGIEAALGAGGEALDDCVGDLYAARRAVAFRHR